MYRVTGKTILLPLLLVCLLGTIPGCNKPEPPPPPENLPPPPPTTDQIYSEIKPSIQLLYRPFNGDGLSDAEINQTAEALRPLKAKHTATENGREALGRLEEDIADIIRQARDTTRWKVLEAAILAYEVLEPGNNRFARLKEQAQLMNQIPKSYVRGFVNVDNEEYVFIEVEDRKTGKRETYKVREQEEFADVFRLVRIIGNNQKVEILYIPANYTFERNGPREN